MLGFIVAMNELQLVCVAKGSTYCIKVLFDACGTAVFRYKKKGTSCAVKLDVQLEYDGQEMIHMKTI